jgi:V/A-type H+-transporting ATPase subunit I
LNEEADALIQENGAEILAYNEQLLLEEKYLQIENSVRVTKRNTTVWGWISTKSIKNFTKKTDNFTENNALVEITKPVFEESEYPTKTSFPRVIKIFDSLVSAYGVPGYKEFNPAIILTIFYPIIFGIMFADVGHGLIFTLVGVYGLTLQNKRLDSGGFMDELKGYFKSGAMLIIISGVVSMIFGVIFGSYLGITHEHATYLPEALWFSPESHGPPSYNPNTTSVILMLELSLLLGMIHMTVGYVLRIIKHIKDKHILEAIFVDVMLTIFHWGLFILVFTFGTNFMDWFQWDNSGYFDMAIISVNGSSVNFFFVRHALLFFIIAFAAPALVMTGYLLTHGLDGAAELIELLLSTLSNTVSYSRIFAMNAVHGALSSVFLLTDFTGEHLGVVNYIGAIIGAVVIVILEGLFSFIQTLRLQWVEFFAKMGYQGTGTKFQAVAYERKYSIPIS